MKAWLFFLVIEVINASVVGEVFFVFNDALLVALNKLVLYCCYPFVIRIKLIFLRQCVHPLLLVCAGLAV